MKRLLALVLCSCGLPGGDVLFKEPVRTLSSCDEALAAAQDGLPCAGFTACQREVPPCCVEKIVCETVTRAYSRDCSTCPSCTSDDGCAITSTCFAGRCEPCARIVECKECPAGLVRLQRNGCETCDCGPPSACPDDGEPGAYCLQNCTGSSCCVKQCRAPACAAVPNPEGCLTDCGTQSCEGRCYAAGCSCSGTTWSCSAKCSPGAEEYTARCSH